MDSITNLNPGPPLVYIRGRMRLPIFFGKGGGGGVCGVVSGRFPEKARKAGKGGGGVFVIDNGNQYPG